MFDIIKIPLNDSRYPSQYVIEIRPVFEYTYYYLTENNYYDDSSYTLKYNVTSLNPSVVVAVPTVYVYEEDGELYASFYYQETKTHFIKEISFGLALFNEQELNIGDTGYDRNSDNGSFITRANINFSGVGNQSPLAESIWSTVSFSLGCCDFLDSISDVVSPFDYIYEMAQNASNDFRNTVEYGDYYNEQYYNTKAEQLQHYSNLNKCAIAELTSNDSKPLLFGRAKDNDYIRAVFTLGMTEDWYTRVIDVIKLSVVTESTDLLGNSTITSRTTSERSTKNNVRSLQAKPLSLESYKSFTMLPSGIAKFAFNAMYGSKYVITIPNASQMTVKIDGVVTAFSGNTSTKLLHAGNHTILIEGKNTEKLTSSITIDPDTMSSSIANKSISLMSGERYVLKVNSLSQVKALNTGNNNVVIQSIFTNNTWNEYVLHGSISPASAITHPFISGNYYIVIKNNLTTNISINFTIGEPSVLTQNSSLTINSNNDNYTYVKFTGDNTTSKYAITASNISGLSVVCINRDSMLSNAGGIFYAGLFYELGVNANQTVYVGIKNDHITSNTLTIKKTNIAYQWGISSNGSENKIADESVYNATRNATYTLKLYVNGAVVDDVVFSYDNQSTAYGPYSISYISNNTFTINGDSAVGGNGIIVYAIADENGYKLDKLFIKIVPQMDTNIPEIITGVINNDDMLFTYSVPKYVTKIEYMIWPYENRLFTQELNNQTGTISFKANYDSLGYNKPQDITIDVTKYYYKDALQRECVVSKYFSSHYFMNTMFADGEGTANSPYGISCRRHFENILIQNDKFYKLKKDIYLYDWSQFMEFKGTLDGNTMRITMTIRTSNSTGDIGLFAKNSGTIKNLYLKASINSEASSGNWQNVGGFAGVNEGTIDSCYLESYIGKDEHEHELEGNIHAYKVDFYIANKSTMQIGGIAGYNKGKILNCRNNGASIFGRGDIGGIAGKSDGYIYNSDNSGRIYYLWATENRSIGGIVGYQSGGTIEYSYNDATISYDAERMENSYIKPAMGKIVGHSQAEVINCNNAGKVNTGSLFKYDGFLGIGSYNQLERAGNRQIGYSD